MSDREDPIDTLADSLFDAGREERAGDDARARAMRALGLDLGPSGGGGGGSGAAGGGGTEPAAPPAPPLGGGLKLVALAAVVGAVGVGAWRMSIDAPEPIAATPPAATVTTTSTPTPTPSPAPSIEPPVSAASAVSAAPSAIAESATIAAKAGKRAPAASASATLPAQVDASRADDLAAELAALDRARKQLRAGDATGALTLLDGYVTDHPRGTLATEATLLRIEALVAAGRKDEARRVAAPLLERRAGDMTGDRARKLLER